jgi:hypothetical protein
MAVFLLAYVSAMLFSGRSDTLVFASVINLAQVWLFTSLLTRALRGPATLTTSREAIWFLLITVLVTGASGLAAGVVPCMTKRRSGPDGSVGGLVTVSAFF